MAFLTIMYGQDLELLSKLCSRQPLPINYFFVHELKHTPYLEIKTGVF